MRLFKISTYFLFTVVFVEASVSKLLAFKTPSWFIKQFEGTFLNLFEGSLQIQFATIVIAELALGITFLTGLIKSIRSSSTVLTDKYAFFGASILFTGLCFGQRITYKFDTAAMLFFYAAVSAFIALKLSEEQNEKS